MLPGAFSSLASLAEVINQKKTTEVIEPIEVNLTSNISLANAGESVRISWDSNETKGTYSFSYACTEGVSVDLFDTHNNSLGNIACDTDYNVGNTQDLSLRIESEKNRSENFNYKIVFSATNDASLRAETGDTITIVNNTIQDEIIADNPDATEEDDTSATSTTEIETDLEEELEVVTPEPSEPIYTQEFVYKIPTSDPNGNADLYTKFIATGRIAGNIFFAGPVAQNGSGAIQFEVKNYGNKTSEDWTYTVKLPGGSDYTSPEQKPLKPNERAVITVGFPANDSDSHTFEVEVDVSADRNNSNNKFSQRVNIN